MSNPVIPNSSEEWNLELDVFNAINNKKPELDQETKALIQRLWMEIVLRETWYFQLNPPVANEIPEPPIDLAPRSVERVKTTCDHEWIYSEGRTASGVLCQKCGAYNVPNGTPLGKALADAERMTKRKFCQHVCIDGACSQCGKEN